MLFNKCFLKALKQIDRFSTRYGRGLSATILEYFKSNNNLFERVFKNINSSSIMISDYKTEEFEKVIIAELCSELSIITQSDRNKITHLMRYCLKKYNSIFFKEISASKSDVFIINILDKIHSEMCTKEDISKLTQYLTNELKNLDISVKSEIKSKFSQQAFSLLVDELENPEKIEFSDPITKELLLLKNNIEKLTKDQFQIIQFLKYHKRVIISGCAGSGKTLLAAEKAIRLDKGGINTLLLCHNPFLAEYIRTLVKGTSVQVFDFYNWVNYLNGMETRTFKDWSEYKEPYPEAIETAFDKGVATYEAIIVDEAQDFRDTWWLLVEATLKDPNILYIFYDDNQHLLPIKSKYPIEYSPFSMSKNCRNAGEIFKLVKQLHYQAPETSLELKDKGILGISSFSGSYEKSLALAIREAHKYIAKPQIVVLTTEPYNIEKSFLLNFKLILNENNCWYNVIEEDLKMITSEYYSRMNAFLQIQKNIIVKKGQLRNIPKNAYDERADLQDEIIKLQKQLLETKINRRINLEPIQAFKIPELKGYYSPSEDDKINVSKYAKSIGKVFPFNLSIEGQNVKWHYSNSIFLLQPTFDGKHVIANFQQKLGFYASRKWYENIPIDFNIQLSPNDLSARYTSNKIPFFTTASFKGLEADAIILFVISPTFNLNTSLYIGISRACTYLHVVINKLALSQLPSLFRKNIIHE